MADNNQDQTPKIIKRTLSPETHEERVAKSKFSAADIIECKQTVADIKAPGHYLEKGKLKKISAASVKKLFGEEKAN